MLNELEAHYGRQTSGWPGDPYQFIVWWNCGYPPSDAACCKGWAALEKEIGASPKEILAARTAVLARALKAGGLIPGLRARRLKEIAAKVTSEFGGDILSGLTGPVAAARKTLKLFHGIADPGADRILLFGKIAAVAAVPSNCPHVLVRIRRGTACASYGVEYRDAQHSLAEELPETFQARMRAYLLLKKHGQELCKRGTPKCDECPLNSACSYFAEKRRGRTSRSRS
jgi:endonuclease III